MDSLEDTKSITNIQTGVGRSRKNLKKWGICDGKEDMNCICGEVQTMVHLLNCNEYPTKYDVTDLQVANNKAIKVAEH